MNGWILDKHINSNVNLHSTPKKQVKDFVGDFRIRQKHFVYRESRDRDFSRYSFWDSFRKYNQSRSNSNDR